MSKYMQDRQKQNWDYAQRLKYEGKCVSCGIQDHRVLQFHHRNGHDSKYSLRQYARWGPDRFKEELNKCDLLCANCHIIKHHDERSGYVAQSDYFANYQE